MADKPLLLTNGHGGKRPWGGARPHWFRDQMEGLIRRLSPKIEEFAESVFNNEPIEPRVTKAGIIFTHATVHDKTVLMCALAKLAGLVDPGESPLREPLQNVINQVQAIKLMQELNYGAHSGGGSNGAKVVVGNGHPETPPDSPAAPAL